MGNSAEYVILAEDLQAQVFIARALRALGVQPRQIRRLELPSGVRAGDDFVRQRYAREVDSYRRRSAAKALFVHVDADPGNSTRDRHEQLAAALVERRMVPRGPGEAIVELVPKRNIETWIHCLAGTEVDEETEYPKFPGREAACDPQATRFAGHVKDRTSPTPDSPSLQDGLTEARRVF